ncbi:MAG: hypothetical protein LBH13_07325 [Cellulomonadaceae bacterium]|jgi:hypothetical protein|nr:hypothetical protein [Cellulomonadaceae bacterium]
MTKFDSSWLDAQTRALLLFGQAAGVEDFPSMSAVKTMANVYAYFMMNVN